MALAVPAIRAEGAVNNALVQTQLYLWNRFADALEVVRCGVAVGPCVGAEVAVTDKAALGAYWADETGATFPHFIPPLWLVPYAEDATVFVTHEGKYHTVAYGSKRTESSTESGVYFEREPLDLRAQVGLGLIHIYAAVKTKQVGDFLAGFATFDPMDDDVEADPAIRRRPADQFGRGASNLLVGWLEIGKNMIRVRREEGELSGFTKGFGLGLWRAGVREVIGVFELVTFPFGWSALIEPEYVIQASHTTDWKMNSPQFGSQY
jgi:putative exosortase-associated protein (TIGR04073 family)